MAFLDLVALIPFFHPTVLWVGRHLLRSCCVLHRFSSRRNSESSSSICLISCMGSDPCLSSFESNRLLSRFASSSRLNGFLLFHNNSCFGMCWMGCDCTPTRSLSSPWRSLLVYIGYHGCILLSFLGSCPLNIVFTLWHGYVVFICNRSSLPKKKLGRDIVHFVSILVSGHVVCRLVS